MTEKITVDLIVFDLDGTLADTLLDLTAAANFASHSLGLPVHLPTAIQAHVHHAERRREAHVPQRALERDLVHVGDHGVVGHPGIAHQAAQKSTITG